VGFSPYNAKTHRLKPAPLKPLTSISPEEHSKGGIIKS
jgi:hypothetical protein